MHLLVSVFARLRKSGTVHFYVCFTRSLNVSESEHLKVAFKMLSTLTNKNASLLAKSHMYHSAPLLLYTCNQTADESLMIIYMYVSFIIYFFLPN